MKENEKDTGVHWIGNRRRLKPFKLGGDAGTTLGLLTGITPGETVVEQEVAKAKVGIRYGVRTITDLTTTGDETLLRDLLDLDLAVGTVPIYGAIATKHRTVSLASHLFHRIQEGVANGVDFFSIHASLTPGMLRSLAHTNRAIPITSRGGALLGASMRRTGAENPFVEVFDELLSLCAENFVALSFVASFRPGSISDADSSEYLDELQLIGALARRATRSGVTTMVELVNHVPLGSIAQHVERGRTLFPTSALGALGPSPTDIAVGLDDVAGAIGAAVAASAGIDWINLVTSGEHSHLPSLDETTQALRYFQLALHIGAISSLNSQERDRALSVARARNDWDVMADLAIDPDLARALYREHDNHSGEACSMCGSTCPLVRARTWPKASHSVEPTGV